MNSDRIHYDESAVRAILFFSLPAHSSDAVLNAELYRSHELVCGHLLVGHLSGLVHPPMSHLALLLARGGGREARVVPGVARSGRQANICNSGASIHFVTAK